MPSTCEWKHFPKKTELKLLSLEPVYRIIWKKDHVLCILCVYDIHSNPIKLCSSDALSSSVEKSTDEDINVKHILPYYP